VSDRDGYVRIAIRGRISDAELDGYLDGLWTTGRPPLFLK